MWWFNPHAFSIGVAVGAAAYLLVVGLPFSLATLRYRKRIREITESLESSRSRMSRAYYAQECQSCRQTNDLDVQWSAAWNLWLCSMCREKRTLADLYPNHKRPDQAPPDAGTSHFS